MVKLKKTKNRSEWTAKIGDDTVVFNSRTIGAGGCTNNPWDNRVWKITKKEKNMFFLEVFKTVSAEDYSFANDERNWI